MGRQARPARRDRAASGQPTSQPAAHWELASTTAPVVSEERSRGHATRQPRAASYPRGTRWSPAACADETNLVSNPSILDGEREVASADHRHRLRGGDGVGHIPGSGGEGGNLVNAERTVPEAWDWETSLNERTRSAGRCESIRNPGHGTTVSMAVPM